MCKISVIVPVYNMEEYLDQCMESILSQTMTDFECLLIDDDSTDRSLEMCNQYAKMDPRVKVVHNQHSGLGETRNVGLSHASGEYIAFIDSDDIIDIFMLQKMYEELESNGADIVECGFEKFYEDGKKSEEVIPCDGTKELSGKELLLKFNDDNAVLHFILCNKLFRKELFAGIRFPYGKLLEDEFVVYRIIYKAKKVILMEDCFYKYRQRKGSIINTCSFNRVESFIEFNDQRFEFFEKTHKEKAIYDTLLRVYFVTVFYYYQDIYNLEGYEEYTRRLVEQARKYYKKYLHSKELSIKSLWTITCRLRRMEQKRSIDTSKCTN